MASLFQRVGRHHGPGMIYLPGKNFANQISNRIYSRSANHTIRSYRDIDNANHH